MKSTIFKILLFFLPIVLIAISLEILLRNIPNDYSFKSDYLDKKANKVEVLILGGSHAFYGLNPRYISRNCFNASYVSQSLNYDLEILKKYDGNWNKLSYVLIPISYTTLFSRLELGDEAWRSKNYAIYYGININNKLINYSEVLSISLPINITRLIKHYIQGEKNLFSSTLGWGLDYSSQIHNNLEESGRIAAIRHSNSKNVYFNDNLVFLQNLIDFTLKRDVKLIFFTPPSYISYKENLNKDRLKLIVSTMDHFQNENKNVLYVNLIDDNSFKAQDYFDADHLNEIGAMKLSGELDSLIVNFNQIKDVF